MEKRIKNLKNSTGAKLKRNNYYYVKIMENYHDFSEIFGIFTAKMGKITDKGNISQLES